jgi:hypothetical protein
MSLAPSEHVRRVRVGRGPRFKGDTKSNLGQIVFARAAEISLRFKECAAKVASAEAEGRLALLHRRMQHSRIRFQARHGGLGYAGIHDRHTTFGRLKFRETV